MDLRTWTFPVGKKLRTSVVFRRSAVRTALVIAATISILLWAFSATWLRPLIKYTVAERSERSIDFDELHIRFNSSLDPTVEFRGLMIQNATWAASRPLVRAGMVSFTFSWRTLFAEQVVIQRLVLLDAEVDLERQADGLRNWRLIHPDDRGPQRVKVLEVDAMRSAVHVVHRGIDLEVDTRVSALAPARTLAAYPKLPLTKWLVFRGSLGGTSFEGEVALSDVLTFGDTSSRFAVVGKAKVGATLVEAEGVASDVQSSADFDLDLRLSSNSLGELWPLPFANAIEEVQPVVTEAHVNKTGSKWTASRLRGTIGHTDFAGDLTFNDEHSAVDRPAYRATLPSKVVDVNDISPLMAMFSSSKGKAGSAAGALPQEKLDTARLGKFDAQVNLNIAKLTAKAVDLASDLQLRAELKDGILDVERVELVAAGGRVKGNLWLDGSRRPAEALLDLRVRGMHLGSLSSAMPETRRVTGELNARVTIRSQGESLTALVNGATGSLRAALRGATISDRFDAELGLNGGRLLRALFTGTQRVPVQCAILAIDFLEGIGKIRRLAVETERTALDGRGSVSLVRESFDAILVPTSKQRSLLALNKAIHLSGSFRSAKVELISSVERPAPNGCARGEFSRVGLLTPVQLPQRRQ